MIEIWDSAPDVSVLRSRIVRCLRLHSLVIDETLHDPDYVQEAARLIFDENRKNQWPKWPGWLRKKIHRDQTLPNFPSAPGNRQNVPTGRTVPGTDLGSMRPPVDRSDASSSGNFQRGVGDAGQCRHSTMASTGMGSLIPSSTREWTAASRRGSELAFQASHPPPGASSAFAEMTGMPRATTRDGATLSTSDRHWRTSRTSRPPRPHLRPSSAGPLVTSRGCPAIEQ